LWAWGRNTSAGNTNGILGTNDAISKSSPVQVGALTNWMISGLPRSEERRVLFRSIVGMGQKYIRRKYEWYIGNK